MKKIITILIIISILIIGCQADNEQIDTVDNNNIPSNCETWFDGCNNCMVSENKMMACTEMYCEVMQEPKCVKYKDESEAIPPNCETWFDGCNNCMVSETGLLACTKKYCEIMKEPKCLKFKDLGAKLQATDCRESQRNVDGCIEIYQPVCGQIQVECIRAPCDPVKQTFENSCKACTNERVLSYTEGECETSEDIKK